VSTKALISVILSACILLIGCRNNAVESNIYSGTVPAPTISQLEEFAVQIQEHITTDNTAAFDALVDYNYVAEQALQGLNFKRGLRPNYVKFLEQDLQVGSQITASFGLDLWYTLVDITVQGNRGKITFRAEGMGTYNYHTFEVAINNKVELRIVDAFYHWSCSSLCDDAYQIAIQDIVSGNHAFRNDQEIDQQYLVGTRLFEQMVELNATGKHKSAYDLLDKLPEKIRNHPLTRLEELTATSYMDTETYKKALKSFASLTDDGINVSFRAMENYSMIAEYQLALDQLRALDSSVGGDAYLNSTRTTFYLELSDVQEAQVCADILLKTYPDFAVGYWCQARVACAREDYETVIHYFDTLARVFEFDLPVIVSFAQDDLDILWNDTYQAWYDTVQPYSYEVLPAMLDYLSEEQRAEWDLCRAAIVAEDFEQAIVHCETLVTTLDLEKPDVSYLVVDYDDFRASQAYKEWFLTVEYPTLP
jgi:hypothetical protein